MTLNVSKSEESREYVEGSGFLIADTYLPKYMASHTGYFKSRTRVGSQFLLYLFTEKCVAVGLIKVDSSQAGRHVDTFPAELLVSVAVRAAHITK
jgi:hypothetical protein